MRAIQWVIFCTVLGLAHLAIGDRASSGIFLNAAIVITALRFGDERRS